MTKEPLSARAAAGVLGSTFVETDQQLLEAWDAGDAQKGEELIDRHYDAIVRFFRTKAQTAWEDLVQRTFLVCAEQRADYRGQGSVRAYLFGIARNLLFEHIRANVRDRARDVDFGVSALIDLSPGVSTAHFKRAEQQLLLSALQRIPLELQLAIELYYWEELSMSDLGRVLGVPEGTVKSRLHRARKLLAEAIQSVPAAEAQRVSVRALFDAWARDVRGQAARLEPDS